MEKGGGGSTSTQPAKTYGLKLPPSGFVPVNSPREEGSSSCHLKMDMRKGGHEGKWTIFECFLRWGGQKEKFGDPRLTGGIITGNGGDGGRSVKISRRKRQLTVRNLVTLGRRAGKTDLVLARVERQAMGGALKDCWLPLEVGEECCNIC